MSHDKIPLSSDLLAFARSGAPPERETIMFIVIDPISKHFEHLFLSEGNVSDVPSGDERKDCKEFCGDSCTCDLRLQWVDGNPTYSAVLKERVGRGPKYMYSHSLRAMLVDGEPAQLDDAGSIKPPEGAFCDLPGCGTLWATCSKCFDPAPTKHSADASPVACSTPSANTHLEESFNDMVTPPCRFSFRHLKPKDSEHKERVRVTVEPGLPAFDWPEQSGAVWWDHAPEPKRHARPLSLSAFAREVHRANKHWWHDPATGAKLDRNIGELLMLVVSEIAECMEGERKDLMDTHLPHRKMAEVELADAIIRIADIAGSRNLHLDLAIASYSEVEANKGAALLDIVWSVVRAAEAGHRGNTLRFARKLRIAIHGIEQYAKMHGYDLWGAVAEKREYNKHRADHKPAARLAANGKKW